MEQKALQDVFLRILAAELNGTGIDEETTAMLTADPSSFRGLYDLSKKHDLAHIVASALQKAGVQMPPEVQSKFQKADFLSVYRLEQMKYAFTQICETLEAAKIPYIPLKGSVIRPYYPEERMRTSCDIDILVKEENLDAAVKALEIAGFTGAERNYHDISLHSPEGVHLELHFGIQENVERLVHVWDYAVRIGGFRHDFTPAFFAFYHFAHMAYHFLTGGCGVRSLLDLWVMKHRMGMDFSSAKEFLIGANLYEFAVAMEQLVDICFSKARGDDFTDLLLTYIVTGGVYGTAENSVAMQTVKPGGSFRYFLHRLFPPYRKMKNYYPILRKAPILLPFCWMARAVNRLCRKKTDHVLAEWKAAGHINDSQRETMRLFQERLNL